MKKRALLPLYAFYARLIPVLFLSNCASQMIPEKHLEGMNQEFQQELYILKKEIRSDFAETEYEKSELLYPAGQQLKLYIESGSGWIRVKAYGRDESLEQARGKTVIYLFRKDYPEIDSPEEFKKIVLMKIDELFKHK